MGYRDPAAQPTLVAKCRLADRKRMVDLGIPLVIFTALGGVGTLSSTMRPIAFGVLGLVLVGSAWLSVWLLRSCIMEVPWPYRELQWSMPAGLFGRTSQRSVALDRIARVTTAVSVHDDAITHHVALEMVDGERLIFGDAGDTAALSNLGSLGRHHAEQNAARVEALVERARARARDATSDPASG